MTSVVLIEQMWNHNLRKRIQGDVLRNSLETWYSKFALALRNGQYRSLYCEQEEFFYPYRKSRSKVHSPIKSQETLKQKFQCQVWRRYESLQESDAGA